MGDLIDVSKSQFVSHFGEKTGHWLYNLARGVDNEPVTSRQLPKSIGCGKNFPGKTSLGTKSDVTHWLKQLATELEERLVKDQRDNHRFARLLTISVRTNESGSFSSVSRSCPIYTYNAEKLAYDALQAISKLNSSSSDGLWKPSIWTLSIAASKFEDKLDNSHCNIESYFSNKSFNSKESFNQSESFIDKSVASTSSECSDKNKISEFIHNSGQKSAKTENSNKSIITSFFTKKQLSKTLDSNESVSLNDGKNEENNELNSCLSVLSDLDDKSLDKISDAEISTISDKSKTDTSSETNKPIGFFARKLKERSEINFNIEFEMSSDVDTNCVNDELGNKKQSTSKGISSHFERSPSESDKAQNFNDNDGTDLYTDLDPELLKQCEQCNKQFPIWEESEHLDYHFALNMSKEFSKELSTNNNTSVSKSSVTSKSAVTKSKVGRKRGSGSKSSNQVKKHLVQTKTLDAFFR